MSIFRLIQNERPFKDTDASKAECLICDNVLSRGSKDPKVQTTTNLRRHLETHHHERYQEVVKEEKKRKANANGKNCSKNDKDL